MFVVFIKEWLNVLSTDRSNHSHLHMNLYKISIFPLCVTPSNDFAVSQSVTVAYFIFGNIGIRIIFCIRTAFAFICTSTATYIAAFYSIHCSGIKLILLKRVKSDLAHDNIVFVSLIFSVYLSPFEMNFRIFSLAVFFPSPILTPALWATPSFSILMTVLSLMPYNIP